MATSFVLQDGQRLPLAGGQRVGLTIQANDILKPQSVQADYSSTLTLADTPEVRAALQQAQAGISLSDIVYTELPGTLEADGQEVLPSAVAIIEQHQVGEGFEAQVLGGNKSFYAAIEGKKLGELVFPEGFEHEWTMHNAVPGAAYTSWEQGYVYDLYDRGKGGAAEGATVHLFDDEFLPSVYVRRVWEQIFTEAGYGWAGPLPSVFDKLLMPTAAAPTYGEAVRTATKLVAGIDNAGEKNRRFGNAFAGRDESVFTVPYDYTAARYGYLAPTQADVYSPVTYRWKAPFVCYVNVAATTTVVIDSPYGSGLAQLFVYRGNNELAGGQQLESKRSTDSLSYLSPSVNMNRLLLQKGQEIEVRLKLNPGQDVFLFDSKWGFEAFTGGVYVVEGNTLPLDSFSVEILPELPPGGAIRLQDLLPDWSQKDFVKGIVGLWGLTQQTDPYTRLVRFTPTGPALVAALPAAPDWQARIDTGQPAPRYFHLSGVAQRNWFRWKEDEANGEAGKGLGDGFLPCADTTLELERDALTLPWAATAVSDSGLPLLPVYKLRLGAASVEPQYDKRTPAPRLLAQGAATRRVKLITTRFEKQNDALVEVLDQEAYITPRISTFAGLRFDFDLLPTYYEHLRAVYARPLLLRPSVRLRAQEVTGFDQLQPVWLEREGAHFYVNKIDNWEEADASTPVDLLRLTF